MTADFEHSQPTWKKSSKSVTGDNNCVEVAVATGEILVRDSKNPDAANLRFSPESWSAFLTGLRGDEFDRPTAE